MSLKFVCFVLLLGCLSCQASNNNAALEDYLALRNAAQEYVLTYNVSEMAQGEAYSNLARESWKNGDYLIEDPMTELRTYAWHYRLDGTSYMCSYSLLEESWSCNQDPLIAYGEQFLGLPTRQELEGASITALPDRQILDFEAKCFQIDSADEQLQVCLASNGLPLYLMDEVPELSYKLSIVAIEYEPVVKQDVLVLPSRKI